MRLWHEQLIPLLPKNQLLGQHRECCALRGNGWNKKHKTVDYAFPILHIIYLYFILWLWMKWKKEGIRFLKSGEIRIIEERQQKNTIILKKK